MSKKPSKKNVTILVLLTVVLLIGAIITIMFVRWNSYYNKVWTPLTTIADNTKCDNYPKCWACINDPEEHGIHKKYSNYYFDLPEKLKYKGAVCYSCNPPFDESIKDTQYAVFVFASIGKDFSDIKWEIGLDVTKSLNYYTNVYSAIVDPDTLKVIEVIYKEDSDIDHMKECEGMIREGISNLRSVYSPYLG